MYMNTVCGVKVKKSIQYRCSLNGKTFYSHGAASRQTFKDGLPKFMGRQKKKGLIAQLGEASDGQPKTCH